MYNLYCWICGHKSSLNKTKVISLSNKFLECEKCGSNNFRIEYIKSNRKGSR